MEFIKNFTTTVGKRLGASLDNLFKGFESSPKDQLEAGRDVNAINTKEELLEAIKNVKTAGQVDMSRAGYYRAYGELAIGRARNLGATEQEIDQAISQGVEKGLQSNALRNRGL